MITGQAANVWTDLPAYENEVEVRNLDPISESVVGVLPSAEDLEAIFLGRVRLLSRNVTFVPAKRAWRRLWLESDKDGPGYSRQKIFAQLRIDSEDAHILADKSGDPEKIIATLCAEIDKTLGEMATLLAERVSTFRAYNALNGGDVVTVRADGALVRHLKDYGEDRIKLRQDQLTDSYLVRLASYFTICPPGEEYVPEPEQPITA